MKRRVVIWAVLVVAAAAYFLVDVRQRARLGPDVRRHRTDMTVYLAAAEALADDQDPYEARNPRGYGYVYPPLLAILFLPLVGWAPENAALVWFLLSAAALLAALLALARLRAGGAALGAPAVAVAVLICLGFAHQGFQRGQVTHVLLGLQVLALAAWMGRRFVLAGLLLGVAAALRVTPLLPAAAVGLGMVVHALRHGGHGPWLRFAGGLSLALVLSFVAVPVAALGAERAREVGDRWLDVTGRLQAGVTDLEREYRIDEWRFKNQAPRRVIGTWTGWRNDLAFEGERPVFPDKATSALVDGWSDVIGWAAVGLALLLGLLWLGQPDARLAPLAFAVAMLLPVLVTRYAWPTHYLMALPAVALASAGAPWRWRSIGYGPAPLVFFVGAGLFYAAHTRALAVLGEAGCLLLACVLFLGLFVAQARKDRPS